MGQAVSADVPTSPGLPPVKPAPATPLFWRLGLAAAVVALSVTAFLGRDGLGPRGQSALGVLAFLLTAAVFSADLRAINWRTVGWGFALQVLLALFVLKLEVFGRRPGYEAFNAAGAVVKKFLQFSDEGARFVFGSLADPDAMEKTFGPGSGFVFAFRALPTIIFVSSFFTVLYHFGVLQFVVRLTARAMALLMQTSGAETLSVTANVFMGQTEAPLIVKPYVERMTRSELLALMVGGMAHISGSLMAVYIGMGADAVAILTTSVMASPCTLYLAKIVLPETEQPQTRGRVQAAVERSHVNVIDAAAAGASDGMRLALNIAAMLIAFLAFIALFNALLGLISPELSLARVFGWVFAPLAHLLGVEAADVPKMADLLGTKLVANEFVAYTEFQRVKATLSPRTVVLASYALTGFANFASIGIQLGGIGALAPARRADLARLGGRALLTGFLVTLVNAAVAGVLL
ncbi:MAG TPA: nucleoside transporter C-terminal domain-containing protein [Gemmataceae bacterium]